MTVPSRRSVTSTETATSAHVTTPKEPRYIPCPYCEGSGGDHEIIPGLGDGPFYRCTACNGDGSLDGYRRYQASEKERMEREAAVMCECGHDAGRHYQGHDGCAWERDEPDERGFIVTCPCSKSCETLMLDAGQRPCS
jgi:hypothetical protein